MPYTVRGNCQGCHGRGSIITTRIADDRYVITHRMCPCVELHLTPDEEKAVLAYYAANPSVSQAPIAPAPSTPTPPAIRLNRGGLGTPTAASRNKTSAAIRNIVASMGTASMGVSRDNAGAVLIAPGCVILPPMTKRDWAKDKISHTRPQFTRTELQHQSAGETANIIAGMGQGPRPPCKHIDPNSPEGRAIAARYSG